MGRNRRQLKDNSTESTGRWYMRKVWWATAILLLAVVVGGWALADWWTCLPDSVQATYVGRASCVECHQKEVDEWIGSDHDRAMDLATEETVLGDFNDAELTHHGIQSRMFRDGDKFMIHTEGPDGNLQDFEVKYVFGVRPLQQYMVEFDRPADMPADEIGRVQVLRISWDTEKKEWFYMPPPDVPEKLDPQDDLHWTGIAQCWNNMCAYCHSTDLQKNYDVATQTYHTTFSEIDVSCEACHGPASVHVELANSRSWFWDRKRGYGLARLKGKQTRPEIETCAPCHSRRQVIAPAFMPGDNYYDYFNNELLQEQTYYAGGQIKDEDYVYGSFIQSKMFHNDIRCTNCHNPHTAGLKHEGNQVCTSCHQHTRARYDTPAHHFHKSESTGALCVECHMPETTYMEVDPRRDHSLRIPRPDLSVKLGTPNACTRCHLTDAEIPDELRAELKQYRDWIDAARGGNELIQSELARLDQWCLDAVNEWYEKDDWGDHYADALKAGRDGLPEAADQLAEVALDRRYPGIVRATAIDQRGFLIDVPDLRPEIEALRDVDPQVRAAAVARFLTYLPRVGSRVLNDREEAAVRRQVEPLVRHLKPLLADPSRVVRSELGRVLANVPLQLVPQLLNGEQRSLLDSAIEEYKITLNEANDRGGSHMALAMLYESLGKERQAVAAYRTAIKVEPLMTGPRSNLAALLDRMVELELQMRGPSGASAAIREKQAAAAKWRQEELPLLARDARLLPNSAAIQYRYGLALYLAGKQEEARRALQRASELEPDNDQFLYALTLFHDKYEEYEQALQCVERLVKLRPDNPGYEELRRQIRSKYEETQ
jgi:tetratricopeptide (TPR) repeat protein